VYNKHDVHEVKRHLLKYAAAMQENEKMTETVTIRMTPSVKAALQEMADSERRKLASYLSIVLEDHVSRAQEGRPKRGAK
jgi:predicted HicB family RNase H-like nuclease